MAHCLFSSFLFLYFLAEKYITYIIYITYIHTYTYFTYIKMVHVYTYITYIRMVHSSCQVETWMLQLTEKVTFLVLRSGLFCSCISWVTSPLNQRKPCPSLWYYLLQHRPERKSNLAKVGFKCWQYIFRRPVRLKSIWDGCIIHLRDACFKGVASNRQENLGD